MDYEKAVGSGEREAGLMSLRDGAAEPAEGIPIEKRLSEEKASAEYERSGEIEEKLCERKQGDCVQKNRKRELRELR